tara:strand:- start:86287 stop:87264 length:978 start_codon:yes stop_codon:yes gene_type:complete
MDPQVQERLMMFGGFIPGAVSMLLLMAAWYLHAFKASRVDHDEHHADDEYEDDGESTRRSIGPRWVLPIMLALGFAGAVYAVDEQQKLWPDSNADRFLHAMVIIGLVGVIEGLVRLPVLVGFVVRFFGFTVAFWMLAEAYVTIFGDHSIFVGSAIFAGLVSSLLVAGADRSSEDTPAWVDAGSWLIIAGASMPIFFQNNFSLGAMYPAGVIAVLVSTGVTGLVFKDLRFARGGNTVLVGMLMALMVGSIIQTGAVNLPAVMLLGVAPMVLLVPLKSASGVRRLLARLVILAAVLGASGGLMIQSSSADAGDGYDDYESEMDYGQE